MKARAPDQLSLEEMYHRTHHARTFRDSAIDKARRAEADAERGKRHEQHLCPWCYYFMRGRIAGQAFTEWTCAHCRGTFMHHNTATPRLCPACAATLEACADCCADIDLRDRRTLTKALRRRKKKP